MYKSKKILRVKATKTLLRVCAMTLLLVGGFWVGKMDAKAANVNVNWEDGKTMLIPEGDTLVIDFPNGSGYQRYMDDVFKNEKLNGSRVFFSNYANSPNWYENVKRVEMKSVLLSNSSMGCGVYAYSTIAVEDSSEGIPKTEKPKQREKTVEEKWRELWEESEHNPLNYLSEIKNVDGTITYSAVPTKINSNVEGVDFIVGQTLKEAEVSFEKLDSENQICVTIEKDFPGEQMRKSVENLAQSLGTEVVSSYNIKATERKKADYKVVREITSVSGKVTYIFELHDKLKKNGRKSKNYPSYSIQRGRWLSSNRFRENRKWNLKLTDLQSKWNIYICSRGVTQNISPEWKQKLM